MKAPSYKIAQAILGNDFITPEKMMSLDKRIVFSKKQLSLLRETVPAQELLEWGRDNNFFLVAGPGSPLSLNGVYNLMKDYFLSEEDNFGLQELLQNDLIRTRWYMIRKDIVPESTYKNWKEQQSLLPVGETTPSAPELIWAIIIYKIVNKICLFHDVYVRTSSLNLDGQNVDISFAEGSLIVNTLWINPRNNSLGLASSKDLDLLF